MIFVVEIEAVLLYGSIIAGGLGPNAELDGLVGLELEVELITLITGIGAVSDMDLGRSAVQSLAGGEGDGDIGPVGVGGLEGEAYEGLGGGVRIANFVPVALILAASGDLAKGVIGREVEVFEGGEAASWGIEDGLVGGGGIHEGEGGELQKVALDKITQSAGLLVEDGAAFDADLLGGEDVDFLDEVLVPGLIE